MKSLKREKEEPAQPKVARHQDREEMMMINGTVKTDDGPIGVSGIGILGTGIMPILEPSAAHRLGLHGQVRKKRALRAARTLRIGVLAALPCVAQ